MNKYQKQYINFLKPFLKPAKPLKIVIDCSNGTSGLIVRGIMNKELGIKNKKTKFIVHNSSFLILNSKPDGNFPSHSPDPAHKGASEQLRREVLRQKADLGIVFDADGDRVFFMDDKGRLLDSTISAYLLIISLKPEKVIINTPIGWLIRKFAIENNFKLLISPVGRLFLEKMMEKENADFGVEFSGHYLFKNFFYRDSGIMAAIEFINAVSRLPYKLSDFYDLSEKYFKYNVDLCIDKNSAVAAIKEIKKVYLGKAEKISHKDGFLAEFKNFWVLLRLSNTEPLLRIYIEALNKRILEKEKKRLLNLVKRSNVI